MNELHLDIGQLVIDGISLTKVESIALQRSVERELHVLLSGDADGVSWGHSHSRHIQGASININSSRVEPAVLGKQVARSIYTGIAKARS